MTQNPRELFSRIAEIAQEEERMDAMTPDPHSTADREPETPTALRFMGETIARQVELGIVIEQAHQSEMRAHRNTQRRLDRANGDRQRLQDYNLELLSREESIRRAMAGEEEPTPNGDVLAEVRELYAKAYNLGREVLAAKALLERSEAIQDLDTLDRTPYVAERAQWFERVDMILAAPEEVNPTCDKPGHLTSSCQHAPDGGNHPMSKEATGEPQP